MYTIVQPFFVFATLQDKTNKKTNTKNIWRSSFVEKKCLQNKRENDNKTKKIERNVYYKYVTRIIRKRLVEEEEKTM